MSTAAQQSEKSILNWASKDGRFKRADSAFRGEVVDSEGAEFAAEKDRYHLYISWACPWAHRTAMVRQLKGLDKIIGLSVVDYLMLEGGWKFSEPDKCPGAIPDTVNHAQFVSELYFKTRPDYSGRFTVPILWDKKLKKIVNNESSEIIRMFNTAFNRFLLKDQQDINYYPDALRERIDSINTPIYDKVNNGVYKAGFATTQAAYEENVYPLFEELDKIESILANQEYLVNNTFTEADIRLWTTVIRFDPVYHGHFKCNVKSIAKDYPNILRWARRIYQKPGVAGTVNMDHIKNHYYMSHLQINPTQVVPAGNGPDLSAPL